MDRRFPLDKCAAAAEYFGYTVFALQAGGKCLSSENALDTYYKYGESVNCSSDEKNSDPYNFNVYQIKKGKNK